MADSPRTRWLQAIDVLDAEGYEDVADKIEADDLFADRVAALLGSNTEWRTEDLDTIATWLLDTGRLPVGDQDQETLGHYRRVADALGIAHDEENAPW